MHRQLTIFEASCQEVAPRGLKPTAIVWGGCGTTKVVP